MSRPDPLLHAVTTWAADLRHEQARAERSARRWQRQLAAEELAFRSVLEAAVASGQPLVLHLEADQSVAGPMLAVGTDFCAMGGTDEHTRLTTLVALAAVTAVAMDAPLDQLAATTATDEEGDADGGSDAPTLAEVLADLVPQRPRLRVATSGSRSTHTGELRAVGEDVLVLTTGTEVTTTLALRIDQIAEITIVG